MSGKSIPMIRLIGVFKENDSVVKLYELGKKFRFHR